MPTIQALFANAAEFFNSLLGADGPLSNRFFGINAAKFLGLGIGQPNRRRLDQYYNLSSKPAWMAKVDSLPAVTT